MNAVEIEEAVSALVAEPFDAAEFGFQFITAFGAKKTTVDRLRRGDSNQSDVRTAAGGGVLQRNNIHIAVAPSVYLTDTAYGLKPFEGRSMRGLCFSFYNSLTLLFSEMEGRFYGGGVLELSPKEFRGLPLVYHEPSDAEFEAFLAAHTDPAGLTAILDFGDRWLGQQLSLSTIELKLLRDSWRSVQSHRMRHGKAAVSII